MNFLCRMTIVVKPQHDVGHSYMPKNMYVHLFARKNVEEYSYTVGVIFIVIYGANVSKYCDQYISGI